MASPDMVVPDNQNLSLNQLNDIIVMERIGGSLSLVSVLLIFITYALVPSVRNVQNTFIVFASVANVGASIASIIAMDGVAQGVRSPLCQAQSFMFEMFMQSDPWWSLAMAVNVFLVFNFRASPDSFQKWWWLYGLICYGGPFVFAITLLLVRDSKGEPVYGDATIWCWVDDKWDSMRIYTYYMLIWICICGSFILYFLVGYHVFRSRNQFRSFPTSGESANKDAGTELGTMNVSAAPEDGAYGTVTTEVKITHSQINHGARRSSQKDRQLSHSQSSNGSAHVDFNGIQPRKDIRPSSAQYFSSVTSSSVKKQHRNGENQVKASAFSRFHQACKSFTNKFYIEDSIKRAYLRTNFLFALSVLVTWIPSSLNRIHGWVAGSSPFSYHMAASTVLPLQGVWNGVIFFVTSWRSLKNWHRGVEGSQAQAKSTSRTLDDDRSMDRTVQPRDDMSLGSDLEFENESRTDSRVELRNMERSQPRDSDSTKGEVAL